MPTPQKEAAINELTEMVGRAKLAIVTDYRGLSVKELATLRRELRKFEVDYTVAKNTLLRIAARNNGLEGADDLLAGPTAVAFCYQDIVGPSKAISDFARTTRILNVRGGLLEGKVIPTDDITRLATMPSIEQLRAEVVGAISGSLASLVGVLNAALQSMVGTLDARAEQMGGEGAAA